MNYKILVTLLSSIFIAVLGMGLVIPILSVYAQTLGAGGFALGMIIAAFPLSRSCLQPIIGNLSDRVGRKKFLIAGLIIYAIAGVLIAQAETVWELILIRLFHGCGSGMVVPVAMAYVSNLTPPGYEGRYMGYLNTAIFTGMGFGPIVGGLFYDGFGYEAPFYGMAAICTIACAMVIVLVPEEQSSVENKKVANIFASIGMMVRDRHTLGVLIARYGTMVLMVPSMAFLPVFMEGNFGAKASVVGAVIACRTFVNAILQFPFGRLADTYNRLTLLLVGVVFTVLALCFVPHATSIYQLFVAYAVLGIAEALVWPTLGAYASEKGREQYGHGTMMGVLNLAMSAGVFTGAIIAGYSMDFFGIHYSFYIPAMVIFAVSSIGMLLIYCNPKPLS